MESFLYCPICWLVLEKEIYQCVEGHVICHTCISKVNTCPHCREPFGIRKIRSRVLEQMLDTQLFKCKFQGEGCTQPSNRGEITNHVNSCSYNPDLISVCERMFPDCTFLLGGVSKAEVISHFENEHDYRLLLFPRMKMRITGEALKKLFEGDLNDDSGFQISSRLFSPNNDESSPLFIMDLTIDGPDISLTFIQVWNPEYLQTTKYYVEYTLFRDPSSSSSTFIQTRSRKKQHPPVEDVFPIQWISKVYPLKEARYILNMNPVSISEPALKHYKFGSNEGDYFEFKVFQSNE